MIHSIDGTSQEMNIFQKNYSKIQIYVNLSFRHWNVLPGGGPEVKGMGKGYFQNYRLISFFWYPKIKKISGYRVVEVKNPDFFSDFRFFFNKFRCYAKSKSKIHSEKNIDLVSSLFIYLHYGVNEECDYSKCINWHQQPHWVAFLIGLMHRSGSHWRTHSWDWSWLHIIKKEIINFTSPSLSWYFT